MHKRHPLATIILLALLLVIVPSALALIVGLGITYGMLSQWLQRGTTKN